MDSGMMDHHQHMTLIDSSADKSAFECCCPDCDCNLGGCATAALPISKSTYPFNLPLFTSYYDELAENQLAVSLFRPPITR